jgi:SAM-dependent methyltransferase
MPNTIISMQDNLDIFQCPVCQSDLILDGNFIVCEREKHQFEIVDEIPLMFVQNKQNGIGAEVTNKIKQFYEDTPFPNYNDTDNPGVLINKAEKTIFAKLLNDELPFNIRVLEVGCGTGQLTNYLSLSNRHLYGTDISINSLALANKFKKQHSLHRNLFSQMNLFNPIFKDNSFNVVICNGVLHHTHNPYLGFKSIVRLLKVGGFVILGLYNSYGRVMTNIRRMIFNITGNRFQKFDPYLKRKDITGIKKNAWFLDQYKNPHESTHTYDEVLNWFNSAGIEFISSIPVIGNTPQNLDEFRLFSKKKSGNKFTRFFTQIAMPFTGQEEGGFFIMIGRKTKNIMYSMMVFFNMFSETVQEIPIIL